MAGPPRSSHTKSRNGCQTCKRRHIRCDETSPRCRNCAKSNRECGYMDKQATRDAPIPTATAAAPPKDITPEIDAVIEQRRTTGTSPCSERLLGHIEHLSDNLHRRGLGETTVWSAHMPRLLIIARSTHFVMSSILALSAFHIAYVTGSQEALSLSHYHRNIAAVGLQVAIGSLSKENCDAILAASLVLSWQAADWAALSTLQKGILSVLDSMQLSCKETSEIARILESQVPSRTRACTTSYRTSGTLQLGNLDSAIADFHRSQERLQHIPELYHTLTELIDLVKQVRSDVPFQVPFSRLQSLQTWILWLPTKLLRGGEGDLGALAVLAHFYSAALVLEPFFAGLEGSYLGCMNLSLIETTDVILHTLQSRFPTAHIAQLAISLMDAPRRTVNDYRTTIQWTPHVPNHSMNCMMPTPSLYRQCDEYPRSSSVTSSPHTPTTISGFGHAVTSPPPFEHSHSYKYGGTSLHMSSTAAPRSDYYDDWLSDYSQPGMIEHWAAFSSYCNEYLHGSPTEVGDSVHPGLVHGYSVSDPPGLWT